MNLERLDETIDTLVNSNRDSGSKDGTSGQGAHQIMHFTQHDADKVESNLMQVTLTNSFGF